VAGTASAGTAGPLDKPQPISRADANSGGANGQCPGGPYCSTRDGSASLNGNGNDKAVGRPAAGSVGRADNKNPHGQMPNGADGNAGYECDRNHGIGRRNPAHTSCIPATTVVPPPAPPVVEPLVPPVLVPPVASPPPSASPAASALVSPEVYVGFLGSLAEALGTNPLPTAAAAGEANTDGQLVAAGTAAFAAFLVLGAGFLDAGTDSIAGASCGPLDLGRSRPTRHPRHGDRDGASPAGPGLGERPQRLGERPQR
jgi:hypothetical protein